MDARRVQEIKRNFSKKLSSELVGIRDTPGDNWSAEAVEAARSVLEDRAAAGTLETDDRTITEERQANETEIANAIEDDTSKAGKNIDTLATLYLIAGLLGLVGTVFLVVGNISHLLRTYDVLWPLVLCGLSASFFAIGWGLTFRKEWARQAAIAGALPLIAAFPIGTIIAVHSFKCLPNRERYVASKVAGTVASAIRVRFCKT